MHFAKRLKERRRELGLSHETLSRKAGVSRSAISMIESGHRSASLITSHALAEALDTTVSQLAFKAEQDS